MNPLASPDSREYELSRFVLPMIETLEAGKAAYQLAYDSVPRRSDPLQADAWIHDSSTTYDTDSISFE